MSAVAANPENISDARIGRDGRHAVGGSRNRTAPHMPHRKVAQRWMQPPDARREALACSSDPVANRP